MSGLLKLTRAFDCVGRAFTDDLLNLNCSLNCNGLNSIWLRDIY